MSCYFFRLICESARQRKRKQQIKEGIEKACQNSPEPSNVFKKFSRRQPGKPNLEDDQPELLSTIIKIMQNSAAPYVFEKQNVYVAFQLWTISKLELKKIGLNLTH